MAVQLLATATMELRWQKSTGFLPWSNAPARSRTWIYRLGGRLRQRRKTLDLLVFVGDSSGHPSRGYGAIRRDPAGFGQRNWAAAQTRDRRQRPRRDRRCVARTKRPFHRAAD